MRVAWVVYGDLAQRTGGTIYDAEVVDGLRAAGDEVRVLALPDREEAARASAEKRRAFGATLPWIAPGASTVTAALRLVREVRALAPDVVVGDELCFRELALAFPLLGKGATLRVLLVHHLTAWETERPARGRRVLRAVEGAAIGGSDWLVTTSRTTRERLLAEGVGREIEVVLPGADRLERARRSASASAKKSGSEGVAFVFVGAVVGRKRVLELVRAFAGGARGSGRLVLVGSTTRDPAYVREVRAAIERLGLGARVQMTGEVDEAGVRQALEDADVLVMPSSLEGYGIAATEAIRAGTPVIAARAQGLEEALAPCPGATIFVDDEPALAAALARFEAQPGVRSAMRAAARDASLRMPTWAACAAGFRAALATRAPPRQDALRRS